MDVDQVGDEDGWGSDLWSYRIHYGNPQGEREGALRVLNKGDSEAS